MRVTKICIVAAVFVAGVCLASSVQATVLPGDSTLIQTLDFSDTFTVGTEARPDNLYGDNSGGGYNLENTYGNPTTTWTPFTNFSFNSSAAALPWYPGNTGNSGAETGMAQSSAGPSGFVYGLARNDFVVQLDGIIVNGWGSGALTVTSSANPGDAIGSANSLSARFRRSGNAIGIGLQNAGGEANTGFTTGIAADDATWHNFAVDFNQNANAISFYVDQSLKGTLDLATFAGGAYQTYSSNAVGTTFAQAGGNGNGWIDNFQVGAPVPEPSILALLATGLMGLLAYAWRKRK